MTKTVPSHYLKQWWPSWLMRIYITKPQWVWALSTSTRILCRRWLHNVLYWLSVSQLLSFWIIGQPMSLCFNKFYPVLKTDWMKCFSKIDATMNRILPDVLMKVHINLCLNQNFQLGWISPKVNTSVTVVGKLWPSPLLISGGNFVSKELKIYLFHVSCSELNSEGKIWIFNSKYDLCFTPSLFL